MMQLAFNDQLGVHLNPHVHIKQPFHPTNRLLTLILVLNSMDIYLNFVIPPVSNILLKTEQLYQTNLFFSVSMQKWFLYRLNCSLLSHTT